MTNVTITFVHKCEEFKCNDIYELKYLNDEWVIVEELDDDCYKVLGDIKYCPYCGEKLETPSL